MRSQLAVFALGYLFLGCGSTTTAPPPADSALDVAFDTPSDAAGTPCGTATCKAGEVCTRTYTTGGACMPCPDDGGACPSGTHCAGACCVADAPSYGYACKPLPASCATPSCAACGADLCGGGGCPCESVSSSVVTCHCLAP